MRAVVRTSLVVGMLLALMLMQGLQGCATINSSPDMYNGSRTLSEHTLRMGTVDSVRAVKISGNDSQPSGADVAIGAVAGSELGNGRGSVLTTIAGGIAGAQVGNAIENAMAVEDGIEITVRLADGDLRVITQTATGEKFVEGDRVRLVSGAGGTRVTH